MNYGGFDNWTEHLGIVETLLLIVALGNWVCFVSLNCTISITFYFEHGTTAKRFMVGVAGTSVHVWFFLESCVFKHGHQWGYLMLECKMLVHVKED